MKVFIVSLVLLFSNQLYAMAQNIDNVGKSSPQIQKTLKSYPIDTLFQYLPENAYTQALNFYDENKASIPNSSFITIVDFTKHSSKNRMFIIDLKNATFQMTVTAHGRGSDRNGDGYADRFSNTPDSESSSLGFYLTAETYSGKHGYSLRLDGLQISNDKARERAIVIHGANYVSQKNDAGGSAGRSWGCPALDPAYSKSIIDSIKKGSLLYVWAGQNE